LTADGAEGGPRRWRPRGPRASGGGVRRRTLADAWAKPRSDRPDEPFARYERARPARLGAAPDELGSGRARRFPPVRPRSGFISRQERVRLDWGGNPAGRGSPRVSRLHLARVYGPRPSTVISRGLAGPGPVSPSGGRVPDGPVRDGSRACQPRFLVTRSSAIDRGLGGRRARTAHHPKLRSAAGWGPWYEGIAFTDRRLAQVRRGQGSPTAGWALAFEHKDPRYKREPFRTDTARC